MPIDVGFDAVPLISIPVERRNDED
jgi:hypothetical protein